MSIKVSKVSAGGLKAPVQGGIWKDADPRYAANAWVSIEIEGNSGIETAAVEFQMPSLSGQGYPSRAQDLLKEVIKRLVNHSFSLNEGDELEALIEAWSIEAIKDKKIFRKLNRDGSPELDKFLKKYKDKIVYAICSLIRHALKSRSSTAHDDVQTFSNVAWPNSRFSDLLENILFFWKLPELNVPDMLGKSAQHYSDVELAKPLGINGTKGHLVERHALSLGLNSLRFTKGSYVIYDESNKKLPFKWSRTIVSSSMSHALTSHKEATRACLQRLGLPVPEGRLFKKDDLWMAEQYAELIGYPVVCKPVAGVGGIGVFANLRTAKELRDALNISQSSQLGKQDVIIEKHVSGEDYRILVLDGKVIAAIMRLPACVVGDGENSIAELVLLKNQFRKSNPHLWRRPIKFNDTMMFQLDRLGLSLESVPAAGELVRLSSSSNISQGGDSISVYDELHEDIKKACVESVKVIPGLNYCGVDFLLEDHTKPLSEQDSGICELNAHAAIGNCEYPLFGEPKEVAKKLLISAANQEGLSFLTAPLDTLHLHSTVKGTLAKTGYVEWVMERAKKFGLSGWIRQVDRRTVEVRIYGDLLPASYLVTALVLGPANAKPTSVNTIHYEGEKPVGFRLLGGKL
ncbi:ATP-grasp domain-containing protein [Halomonas sp. KG2]|uniref:ATP-binding protein n=1 Tax=Halomonas sp. KG2 TaxID=2951138 RepID=UPI002648C2E6|nr:acylphosphatase [Halomonas sp. KG2]WKD27058.1 ATP-grasp domain-containing protein [Halomonas sp. KG2]